MKYRVVDGLDFDNVAYATGDMVAIDDETIAAQLVEAGVIEGSSVLTPDLGGDTSVAADNQTRAAQLIAAIALLEPDNTDHWTSSGKPKTEALEAVCDLESVSAAERDAAFKAYLAGKEEQTSGRRDGKSRREDPPSSGGPDGDEHRRE